MEHHMQGPRDERYEIQMRKEVL